MSLSSAAVIGAIISLAMVTSAEAKRRPTIDSPGTCFNAPDADYDCDGTICSCCYEDGPDAGCWICNAGTPADCVWDPKVSSGRRDIVPQLPDTLTISPGENNVPIKPPMKGPAIGPAK
jgi:hypothetical protein